MSVKLGEPSLKTFEKTDCLILQLQNKLFQFQLVVTLKFEKPYPYLPCIMQRALSTPKLFTHTHSWLIHTYLFSCLISANQLAGEIYDLKGVDSFGLFCILRRINNLIKCQDKNRTIFFNFCNKRFLIRLNAFFVFAARYVSLCYLVL